MNVSIEEKKTEALKRMKLWGLDPKTISKFEENGEVALCYSPILPNISLRPEQAKRVSDLEKAAGILVYFVISGDSSIGMLDTMLYVSDDTEEWETDRNEIENGVQAAYVYNYDAPYCSEFGHVGIQPTMCGGLERIW